MASARSRRAAVEAAHQHGTAHLELGAAEEPGPREWLRDLPDGNGAKAAAFDTRLDRSPWMAGVASRGIAKRLRHGVRRQVSTRNLHSISILGA